MKARLAFYKAEGTLVDKVIRWWTRSNYSHVELVIDGLWYSSSPRDGGVRKATIVAKDNWDLVEVEVEEAWVEDLYRTTEKCGYDFKGILGNEILPFRVHSESKYYCSEWCAEALRLEDTLVSPEKLYQLVAEREKRNGK